MMAHLAVHLAWECGGAEPIGGTIVFSTADWFGTALLVLGAGLNFLDTRRWRRQQGRQLQTAVAHPA